MNASIFTTSPIFIGRWLGERRQRSNSLFLQIALQLGFNLALVATSSLDTCLLVVD